MQIFQVDVSIQSTEPTILGSRSREWYSAANALEISVALTEALGQFQQVETSDAPNAPL